MSKDPERTYSFTVSSLEKEQRIDHFIASRTGFLSRSRVQGLIRNGSVAVNGKPPKTSYRLREGDQISLFLPPARPYRLEPEAVEFELIHEDASLLVLNKPAGLVVHPAPGHSAGTLVHGLVHYCKDLSGIGGVLRPGIVHRLDKDTSGLLVVAKSDRVHAVLSNQFKAGSVKKRYAALVHGVPEGKKGMIALALGRHPRKRKEMSVRVSGGKEAVTFWEKVEELGGQFCLLAVYPKTGRTHQIRVHLSHSGHPIVGDPVYGPGKNWWKRQAAWRNAGVGPAHRQMLHAERLGFFHPDSGAYCEFHAPMPTDMTRVLRVLKSLCASDKKLDIQGD
ncbi:MAG: RluA family pseudouridine synthase [Deltaproteobacteria bacterium]|nr:RluA family pseudouridine synthase [Deltaproteobacteria bacterium]